MFGVALKTGFIDLAEKKNRRCFMCFALMNGNNSVKTRLVNCQ